MNIENRVKITTSCNDCENLERHPKSGQIETDESGNKYQYMFNGVKILYGTYHSPWMNDIIKTLKGHHEPQEELCFHYVLKTLGETANMIELGANWSYYSIWFNKVIKTPSNICIEPILDNLINGKKNIELNGCQNMESIHGYIGSTFERQTNFKNWDGQILKLDSYPLEKLINDTGKYYDVVHSDIQGGELMVLETSKSVFDKIGYFVISTHDDKHNKCLKVLKENNFTILIEHSIEESYSADGLIVAINNTNKGKYEKNINSDLSVYFDTNCKITKK